jgi:hypothetical protein
MEAKIETINYVAYLEPYVDGDVNGPGESQFAYWCDENGHQFDIWLMNVVDSIMSKHGVYRVKTREEFEAAAELLYHTYN